MMARQVKLLIFLNTNNDNVNVNNLFLRNYDLMANMQYLSQYWELHAVKALKVFLLLPWPLMAV